MRTIACAVNRAPPSHRNRSDSTSMSANKPQESDRSERIATFIGGCSSSAPGSSVSGSNAAFDEIDEFGTNTSAASIAMIPPRATARAAVAASHARLAKTRATSRRRFPTPRERRPPGTPRRAPRLRRRGRRVRSAPPPASRRHRRTPPRRTRRGPPRGGRVRVAPGLRDDHVEAIGIIAEGAPQHGLDVSFVHAFAPAVPRRGVDHHHDLRGVVRGVEPQRGRGEALAHEPVARGDEVHHGLERNLAIDACAAPRACAVATARAWRGTCARSA